MQVDPARLATWTLADWERWDNMQGRLIGALQGKATALRGVADAWQRYLPHARTLGDAERLALADGDTSVTEAMQRWRDAARRVYDLESHMICQGLRITSARAVHLDADGEPLFEYPAEDDV